jgi:phytoene synthase
MKTGRRESAQVLAAHSKSFALAGRLFPPGPREDAAAVYAWCRLCDDAVDLAPAAAKAEALAAERERLARVYADEPPRDAILRAFQEVVRERRIPACYPEELLEGLAMDADGRRYESLHDLLLYCYRVAGTVGLMMCHVMGVSDPRGLRHAAHLGMAMQLTNIARDVLEDWGRGHVYVPDELLGAAAAARLWDALRSGCKEPPRAIEPELREAVRQLLAHAAQLYRSGDAGMRWLSWRCSLSVRTARHVYAEIGELVEARGCDVWQGRAVVPTSRKLRLVGRAAWQVLLEAPSRLAQQARPEVPSSPLPYSRDLATY